MADEYIFGKRNIDMLSFFFFSFLQMISSLAMYYLGIGNRLSLPSDRLIYYFLTFRFDFFFLGGGVEGGRWSGYARRFFCYSCSCLLSSVIVTDSHVS